MAWPCRRSSHAAPPLGHERRRRVSRPEGRKHAGISEVGRAIRTGAGEGLIAVASDRAVRADVALPVVVPILEMDGQGATRTRGAVAGAAMDGQAAVE